MHSTIIEVFNKAGQYSTNKVKSLSGRISWMVGPLASRLVSSETASSEKTRILAGPHSLQLVFKDFVGR